MATDIGGNVRQAGDCTVLYGEFQLILQCLLVADGVAGPGDAVAVLRNIRRADVAPLELPSTLLIMNKRSSGYTAFCAYE